MKAIILCAGRGTRLRPLTFSKAKHLIPIANKPVMLYGLEAIVEAGITEVGVIVGENRSEFVRELGGGERWGIQITYLTQDEPRGLADAARVARDYCQGEPFLMYLGDNIFQTGMKEAVKLYKVHSPQAITFLSRVEDPRPYGVVELEGERVVRVVEKPKEPKSNWVLAGAYIFESSIFEVIDQLKPSRRGEYEITDAIQGLVDRGYRVMPYFIEGWWVDAGNAADMLRANRLILRQIEMRIGQGVVVDERSTMVGDVILEDGVEIRNSTVRGPAIIGARSRVVDSFIGSFTSIGRDVTIEHSEIEHSIVMDGSTISNIEGRIDDSVLGRNTTLTRAGNLPRAHRFLISDESQVELV